MEIHTGLFTKILDTELLNKVSGGASSSFEVLSNGCCECFPDPYPCIIPPMLVVGGIVLVGFVDG